ncbi:hypothetical protein Tco_1136349 [Tanacetum coccineum]
MRRYKNQRSGLLWLLDMRKMKEHSQMMIMSKLLIKENEQKLNLSMRKLKRRRELRKIKLGTDSKLKKQKEETPDEDKVIDVDILDHQYPIVEWKSFYLTTKPQYDPTKPLEDAYLNMVTRSNGNKRFFRTLMGVLSIFDREDLKAVYELGKHCGLLGGDEQLNWKIISWKLHSSSGVHTIMTSNGLVIHMLVENRYPLTKEVLSQMLDLKLETEEDSTMALELIKFVKQQLEEFKDSDDDDLAKSDHEEAEKIHPKMHHHKEKVPHHHEEKNHRLQDET